MNTIVKKIYDEVVSRGIYDLDIAQKHITQIFSEHVMAKELPLLASVFLNKNHAGCCLHYGMTLFQKLRENNIDCFIAISKEENVITHKKTDNHVSVCYPENGKYYIADPVATVKAGKGDFSAIPLEQFKMTEGIIWLFDPYGVHGNELFFDSFLAHPIKVFEGGA